jgi:hypothetical protein
MTTLSTHFIIEAPADAVWQVIGPGYAHIGDWATAIPASTAATFPPAGEPAGLPVASAMLSAPVAGRVCQTGIGLAPQVTEILTAYDDSRRTLTYQAAGMPAFVTAARNTWTVTAIDGHRTRVSLHAQFDTRGLLGRLAGWGILTQARRTGRHLGEDLRHYIEHGTPSPRKQAQLSRRRMQRLDR